jgi:hypothetical protein
LNNELHFAQPGFGGNSAETFPPKNEPDSRMFSAGFIRFSGRLLFFSSGKMRISGEKTSKVL